LLKRILSGDEVAKMNGVEAAPKETDLHKRHLCGTRRSPQGSFRPANNPIDVGASSVKFVSVPRPRGGMVDTRDLKSVNPIIPTSGHFGDMMFFSKQISIFVSNSGFVIRSGFGHFLATF
jgi:hypothetical protein